jgi:hypothetical protein
MELAMMQQVESILLLTFVWWTATLTQAHHEAMGSVFEYMHEAVS